MAWTGGTYHASTTLAAGATHTSGDIDASAGSTKLQIQAKVTWPDVPTKRKGLSIQIVRSTDGTSFESRPSEKTYYVKPDEQTYATPTVVVFEVPASAHQKIVSRNAGNLDVIYEGKYSHI